MDELDNLVTEALDYIKDVSARYKGAAEILALNKTINRLDIEKDAKAGIAVETRPPYTTAMAQMFPGIVIKNSLVQLGKIEHDIFDSPVLGPPGAKHSWLKKPGKGYVSSFMPEHMTNAYHDSGYNPKDIKQDFLTWITPGSFIDPAGRDKPYMDSTRKFPEVNESIRIPLDIFGFPTSTGFFAEMLENDECNVAFKVDEDVEVDITRDGNFLSISEGVDYFCGNPQKNQAINNASNTDDSINEIKKYTIAKELSDFSQILFAIINMIRMSNEEQIYKHCVFTTDNVVAARSKLMGIQSCLQNHEITTDKSAHRVILYLAEMDAGNAARELRTTYLNACVKNNNTVKSHIARAIIQGLYIDPQNRITVREGEIKDYLLDIVEAIDKSTEMAQALPLDSDENTDIYKKEILKYYAKTPINEKGRVVQSLQRLFVNCNELREHDQIYNIRNEAKGRQTFGQQLHSFIKPMRGGRKTRKFLTLRKMKGGERNNGRTITDEELNSLFASETDVWDGTVVSILPGSILSHMRLIVQATESDFEDFIFRGFNHLLYICETPLDDRLLSLYSDINNIENSELEAFNIEYSGYNTNPELFAKARARLESARAEDPMNMLANKEPALTREELESMGELEELSENGYETEAQQKNLSQMEVSENGYETEAQKAQKVQRKLTPIINPKAKPSIYNKQYEKKIRNQRLIKQNLVRRGAYAAPSTMVFTRKQRKSRRNTTFKK